MTVGDAFSVVLTIAFAVVGIFLLIVNLTSFVISESQWACTESTVKNGAAVCVKYERKEK